MSTPDPHLPDHLEALSAQQSPQAQAACRALEQLWHENFPMAKAMGVTPTVFHDHALVAHAPLAPNTNIHQTAFAGSLYAIEALTAWGLIYLESAQAGLETSIIHASGQIDFARTLRTDIVAVCAAPDMPTHLETLRTHGKVRFDLHTQVWADNEVVSEFTGNYAVRLAR